MKLNYDEKKVVIATHVYTTGPGQDLRDFLLKNKVGKLLFIGHPLFYDTKLKGSSYELYNAGDKITEYPGTIRKYPDFISYIIHTLYDILFVLKHGRGWDLYVGSNCLNAFAGLILRKLGFVRQCVYYVIDYNPVRFSNTLLNNVYHFVDRLCVLNCNEVWNVSPRMKEGRSKYFNLNGGNQITVPIGVWYDRIKRLPFEDVDRYTLVFMGHLLKKQGVQNVINALPEIIQKLPPFKFLVVGGGVYLDELELLVGKLQMQKHVTFTGYVNKHEDLENILIKCAAAIAPYQKYDEEISSLSFTYYSDPAKIKTYLACGLPVLLTELSYNAMDIAESRCGKIITTDPHDIAQMIIGVMNDEQTLREYRSNAVDYASRFNWEVIFSASMGRVL